MKYSILFLWVCLLSFAPCIVSAQVDTTTKATTTSDSAITVEDTVAIVKNVDTAVVAIPMNCYKQWLDYFTSLGTKPLSDGMHEVVIAFKSKESCHCYMGKVDVLDGKIRTPVYVQTEGGDYKTFTALGKNLDTEFIAAQGAGLWSISNGMSVVFQTTEAEYGRIFFYKFLNKNKEMIKEAPSPSDLLK